jgi:adenine-specific DNA-methyltransferase
VDLYERIYTESAEYKINSFALFIERGLRLLPRGGVLTYIIPSTLLQNEYLKKIRRFLLSRYALDEIISFANRVFTATTDSIVIVASAKSPRDVKTKVYRKNDLDFRLTDPFTTFDPNKWLGGDGAVISIRTSGPADTILRKLTDRGKPLEQYLEAKIGIKRADAPIRDHAGRRYKPFLLGRDMSRYVITFKNAYILFDTDRFHTPVDEQIFLQRQKILVRKTGSSLVATLDEDQRYTDQTLYNLFSKNGVDADLLAILGQLNSRLLNYYFSKVCVTNPDIYPYIKGIHLKKLPIVVTDVDRIAGLVRRVLAAKKRNPRTDTSALEREIDNLVYGLYRLTPEEVQIVESASAPVPIRHEG